MRKKERIIKGIGLFLLNVTWCAPQCALGSLLSLLLFPFSRMKKYRGMIVLYHPFPFSIKLGTFAFLSNSIREPRSARARAYGRYLVSCVWGPLFLFAIFLPGMFLRIPAIRRRREERGIFFSDFYGERQAARLASRFGENEAARVA